MSRRAVVALALVVLAAGIWLALRLSSGDGIVARPEAPPSPTVGAREIPLSPPSDPTEGREVATPDAEDGNPAATEELPVPEPFALVRVEVLTADTDEPVVGGAIIPQPIDPLADWSVQVRPEHEGDAANAPQTDEDGRAVLRLPPGDWRIFLGFASKAERPEALLLGLQAGEERTLRLRATAQQVVPFWGRVRDARTGEPIADASFAYDPVLGRPSPTPRAMEVVASWEGVRSDASGSFHGSCLREAPAQLVASAPGYAPSQTALQPGHESPERAADLLLFAEAVLEVRLSGEDGAALAGAMLELHPDGGGLLAWGDPPGPEGAFAARTDARGSARFEGLPPGERLLPVLREEARVVTGFAEMVTLEAGETRRLAWSLRGGRIAGRVLDVAGEPVAPVQVLLERFAGEPDADEPSVEESGDQLATTAVEADGTFAFDGLCAGTWRLTPVAPDWPWDWDPWGPPLVVRLRSEERLANRDLVVAAGGTSITGRAEPAGPGVLLASGPMMARGMIEPDGTFRLGPLVPGSYRLSGQLDEGGGWIELAEPVDAGSSGVVLRRPDGACLAVSVEGAGGVSGTVSLLGEDFDVSRRLDPGSDTTVTFEGIPLGTYALTLVLEDGRSAARAPLAFQEAGPPVRVVLRPAPSGTLRVQPGEPALRGAWVWLEANGIPFLTLHAPVGEARDHAVPPGTYRVRTLGDVAREETFTIAAGEMVEVVLQGR